MITPLSTGGAFWSTGKSNARRTALGATTIVVLLALISWLVWMSPTDNPIRKAVSDVVKPISTNMQLKSDRANLLGQLVSTKSTITNQSAQLASQKAELSAALGKAKALQTQLAAAKSAAAKAEGKAASYKAQMASGSAGTGSAQTASGSDSTTLTAPVQSDSGSGSNPTTPTAPTGPVALASHSLSEITSSSSKFFGLYTQQSPFNWAENDDVASDVGEEPNMSGYFQGFDSDFRSDAVNRAWAKGQVPFLTWETQPMKAANNLADQPDYQLSKIYGGDFDAYLTKYAKAIVANGQPLAIRLDQEMNADWYPWGEGANGNSKGDFVKMWDHVHQIFADNGANKYVAWVWSPNRVDNLTSAQQTEDYLQEYYPGPDEVDIVGMSAYLRPPYSSSETYSFEHTFGKTLTQLRDVAKGKPILLSEIGASENGGQKVKWINDLFANLNDPANADIIGFGWFNHTITSTTNGTQYTNDWRLNSSASSTAAFKSGLQSLSATYKLTPVN